MADLKRVRVSGNGDEVALTIGTEGVFIPPNQARVIGKALLQAATDVDGRPTTVIERDK